MKNSEFKEMLSNRSFKFAKEVILLTDKFPKKRSSWVISDQLIRSACSIGANIIEAQAASSKKDFINFLNNSLKSGNETKYWLSLAKELDVKLNKEIDKLINEANELTKILGASILKLKGLKVKNA
jgi:four helix bundle protein